MDFLGIDIGGTKTAFRYAGRGGARETVVRWSAPGGGDLDDAGDLDDVDDLTDLVRGLREVVGPRRRPLSVGVAVPAALDAAGRVLAWPNRPGWRGVDLRALLAVELPTATVHLGDDGDLATLAEAEQAGYRDLLYVGVGTGVGGGLFLGGALLGTERGPVAEVGHVVVDPAGPPCRCGRRGCVQAVAAGPATLRRAATTDPAFADARALRAAVRSGDLGARRVLRESAEALAIAVVGVAELVRPALVRLGGGFTASVPELVPAVAAAVRALDRPGHPTPLVEPAAHGGASSLAGALLLARRPELLTRRHGPLAG